MEGKEKGRNQENQSHVPVDCFTVKLSKNK